MIISIFMIPWNTKVGGNLVPQFKNFYTHMPLMVSSRQELQVTYRVAE